MKSLLKSTFCAAGILIYGAVSANAGVVVYTDRTAWIAALNGGALQTDTLASTPNTVSATNSISLSASGISVDVTAGVSNAIGDLNINGGVLTMRLDTEGVDDPSEITFSLPGAGRDAFAIEFNDINNPASLIRAHLEVEGEVFNLYDLGANGTGSSDGFVGIVTMDAPLTSFMFHTGSAVGRGLETFNISEIELGTVASAIPEPGMLALFGLGLAGIGFARRRRAA